MQDDVLLNKIAELGHCLTRIKLQGKALNY